MPFPAVEECPTVVCSPCQTRVPDQIRKQKGSVNTATFRREHQNRLSADTTAECRSDTTVLSGRREGVEDRNGES